MMSDEFVSTKTIRPGSIWTHYSGAQFEVVGVAFDASDHGASRVIVYRGLRSGILYFRTPSDFLGSETVDGYLIPRFTEQGSN